eukprot:6462113-Amphidinium_carterae.1
MVGRLCLPLRSAQISLELVAPDIRVVMKGCTQPQGHISNCVPPCVALFADVVQDEVDDASVSETQSIAMNHSQSMVFENVYDENEDACAFRVRCNCSTIVLGCFLC